MDLKVLNFPQKENLCKKFNGQNVSPEISWNTIKNAKSYALILEDPNAVGGTFIHWYIPYISFDITSIGQLCFLNINNKLHKIENFNIKKNKIIFGKNSLNKIGYTGLCPPIETGLHNYIFTIYALNNILNINKNNNKILDSKMFEDVLIKNKIKILDKFSIGYIYKYK